MIDITLELGGFDYLALVIYLILLGYVRLVYHKRRRAAGDKDVLADLKLGNRPAGNGALVIGVINKVSIVITHPDRRCIGRAVINRVVKLLLIGNRLLV